MKLSVVAPCFVDKHWAFSNCSASTSLCAVSDHLPPPLKRKPSHGWGHRLPLIFWADSYLSVTPPETTLAHSAVWNPSQRNPVSTVWPPFNNTLTPKCLSVKSAGFGGGDPHPCHSTSSPYPFIRGEDIHGKTAINAIIWWTYTVSWNRLETIVQRHHQSCTVSSPAFNSQQCAEWAPCNPLILQYVLPLHSSIRAHV